MTKILYQPRTLYLKPIEKPNKVNIFDHLILFINEDDMSIERAVPDFEERYFDSESSNISKINEDTYLSYFEIIDKKSCFLPSNEPIFEVTIFEGQADNPTQYVGPKVIFSRCINFYSSNLEDFILESKEKNKIKK